MNQQDLQMRVIEKLGMRWPVDASWTEVEPGLFQGDSGLFKLFMDDNGDLIDPGRRAGARKAQPGDWQLVRTQNGVALAGSYSRPEAQLLVYCIRPDVAHLPEGSYEMPEVQATYALTGSRSNQLVRAIREALSQQPIDESEYGTLDAYGHAAMGPIPVSRSWAPVGDVVDNSKRSTATDEAHLMLVGGGWLMFTDQARCCGVMLQPLAWRSAERGRVEALVTKELGPKGLSVRMADGARAWRCDIDPSGFSYTAHDSRGAVGAVGAFWTDRFGQTWRAHYWFRAEHGRAVEARLATLCDRPIDSP